MIIKAPEERFPTAPEGTFAAVCVDEIDIGIVTTSYMGEERDRHMVRLVWQLDEKDDKGKPFLIKQDYTASLDEKASLRKMLNTWRGRAFSSAELMGFDLEQVVGVGCMIAVVHNTGRKGGTFANVGSVMKMPKTMATPSVEGYVRVKDRTTHQPAVKQEQTRPPEEMPPLSDDDVPF